MGRSINIYSSETIQEADFVQFVTSVGGVCMEQDNGDLDVVLERPEGTVWIYGARSALKGDFESPYVDAEPGEVQRLDDKLGGGVNVSFYLRLARERESAAVALDFARRFAARWRAVVNCVAYDVLSAATLGSYLDTGWMPYIACGELSLVLLTVPDIAGPLETLGGLAIVPNDQWLLAAAERALEPRGQPKYNIQKERIEGFLYEGGTEEWVFSEVLSESLTMREHEERFGSLVVDLLARPPRMVVRMEFGFGSPREAEQVCLSLARRLLGSDGGVMEGSFGLVLDAAEIEEWFASDYGWRIR